MKLELNQRDLSLFEYLHSCKVSTTNQINRDFFKRSLVTTRKRLAKLRDHGLIEVVLKGLDRSKPNAYSLSYSGLKLLKKYYPDKYLIDRYKSNSIDHDLILVDLKSVFSSKKIVAKFWSENEVQTHSKFVEDYELSIFRALQVDGLVKLCNEQGDTVYCAVEYESTIKSKSRYALKLKQYYDNPAVEMILFISRNLAIEDVVKSVEIKNFKLDGKKIYYALCDDIKLISEKLVFKNQESLMLEIR